MKGMCQNMAFTRLFQSSHEKRQHIETGLFGHQQIEEQQAQLIAVLLDDLDRLGQPTR